MTKWLKKCNFATHEIIHIFNAHTSTFLILPMIYLNNLYNKLKCKLLSLYTEFNIHNMVKGIYSLKIIVLPGARLSSILHNGYITKITNMMFNIISTCIHITIQNMKSLCVVLTSQWIIKVS